MGGLAAGAAGRRWLGPAPTLMAGEALQLPTPLYPPLPSQLLRQQHEHQKLSGQGVAGEPT